MKLAAIVLVAAVTVAAARADDSPARRHLRAAEAAGHDNHAVAESDEWYWWVPAQMQALPNRPPQKFAHPPVKKPVQKALGHPHVPRPMQRVPPRKPTMVKDYARSSQQTSRKAQKGPPSRPRPLQPLPPKPFSGPNKKPPMYGPSGLKPFGKAAKKPQRVVINQVKFPEPPVVVREPEVVEPGVQEVEEVTDPAIEYQEEAPVGEQVPVTIGEEVPGQEEQAQEDQPIEEQEQVPEEFVPMAETNGGAI